jgi:c-di-GMP-binding flagellar brake protein YcgR
MQVIERHSYKAYGVITKMSNVGQTLEQEALLAHISHQDHGSKLTDAKTSLNRDRHAKKNTLYSRSFEFSQKSQCLTSTLRRLVRNAG